jgi:membrane associated rhomboid family serine protease
VIKTLLITNVVLWLLFDVFLGVFTVRGVPVLVYLTQWFALWPLSSPHFYPWQLLTYLFLHGGLWHLFFNMLALWMFGMELEHLWGSRKFLVFYLLCGLAGGITNLVVSPFLGQAAPTIGASGAVFGVLLAFGMLFPDRPIYLYFLLPVRAKYFIAAYIGLELFFGVTGTTDGVAHFAHLGGAAAAALFVLGDRGVLPFREFWDKLRGLRETPHPPGKRYDHGNDVVQDASFFDIRDGRRLDDEEITQEMVDDILDKITRSGYQSLSDEEKRILNDASKKIH